ncbi:MAG: hypothetical protein M1818_002824 [Claussenomyces sp. TS43310]|nr:MAG: hypothetical protein M1818_002824 [Claussenomyces sp. TS43310]
MAGPKYQKLHGKHVIIIGGTSGIGYAVAEASLESGAAVTISSSSESRVQAAIQSLRESYPSGKVTGYACDLSQPSLEQDLEALFAKTGRVNHIVFTAGDKLATAPLQENTLESMHRAGHIRFFAPLLTAKVGSRYMDASSSSSIVLTTGAVAERPTPQWSIVASYAAGLHGMTRNLALDLKPIRVNLVSPGGVDTEMWNDLDAEQREALYKVWADLPTGKVGKAEDVAEAYLWFMKDSNVTGRIAHSDSGVMLI